MGIQSFTPSSGGLPGQSFIGQIFMDTPIRSWTQAGGPGYYTIKSAKSEAGYVYYVGSVTVGAPLGGIAYVPNGFTSIKVVGVASDLCSLYKVSVKSTSLVTSTPTLTYFTSTTSSATLPSNKTGFIDALLVGGGGFGGQHGGGGGAGGVVLINSFPFAPSQTFSITIGSGSSSSSPGGDTIFAGVRAKGGGSHSNGGNSNGTDGGCGSGAVSHNTTNTAYNGGKTTQGTGTAALSSPLLFFGSFGNTASALGQGFDGGGANGNNHNGGGGGGAGGSGTYGADGNAGYGGPGYLLSWDNTHYAAGGGGGRHTATHTNGYDRRGTGWSASGYGMGGNSRHSGNDSNSYGTNGVVVVRSYDLL